MYQESQEAHSTTQPFQEPIDDDIDMSASVQSKRVTSSTHKYSNYNDGYDSDATMWDGDAIAKVQCDGISSSKSKFFYFIRMKIMCVCF